MYISVSVYISEAIVCKCVCVWVGMGRVAKTERVERLFQKNEF